MTSASLLILGLKIKVDWDYIKYVTFGGVFGLILGTYYIVPLISPPLAKLFFVSLWLSFGLVLWYENTKPERDVFDKIQNFAKSDMARLVFFGLIGGMISSLFGTGINIFTFCLMTIYYRINEKVAVPSSVIIMTLETLLGFFIHGAVIGDFQQEAFEMWLACVPFVAFFAPLGSFVISKLPRKVYCNFSLYHSDCAVYWCNVGTKAFASTFGAFSHYACGWACYFCLFGTFEETRDKKHEITLFREYPVSYL